MDKVIKSKSSQELASDQLLFRLWKKFKNIPLFINYLETFVMSLPQDIKILDGCPAGPVLPHGEKLPL